MRVREMISGIFGIGVLTVGKLKYRLEKEILKEVRKSRKEVYNYNFALQLASARFKRNSLFPNLQ